MSCDERPPAIAVLTATFPAPSQTFIRVQVDMLAREGARVAVYALARGDDPGIDGVTVDPRRIRSAALSRPGVLLRSLAGVHLPARGAPARAEATLRLFWAGLWLAPGRGYDATLVEFATLARYWRLYGAPWLDVRQTLIAVRGSDLTAADNRRRLAREIADGWYEGCIFLPVCQSLAVYLRELGVPSGDIRVHHSGLDLEQFPFDPRALREGPLRIACAGRLTAKKGHVHLVRTVATLRERGRDVTLDILGDGEERSTLEREIAALGLGAHVRFAGTLAHAEMIARIREGDLFALHSVTAADGAEEGIPNVLKEAMALGVPVVATRHGGIPELIDNGRTGHLCDEGDAGGMADAVERWLDAPAAETRSMLEAARRCVEDEFDARRQAATLLRLIGEERA